MKRKAGRVLPALLIAAAFAMALLALLLRLPRGPDLSTLEGRAAFLSDCGWEIDPASEEQKSVTIPDCGAGVMAEYNALQLSQGCDLSKYTGKVVTQYSYRVTNYPGYDRTVYAVLYVSGRRVIAGDIHSAALGGFMQGLRRSPET